MADKSIIELQKVDELQEQSSIPVYQDGTAKRVTGGQIADFAKEQVSEYIQAASDAATAAKESAQQAANKAAEAAGIATYPPKIQNGNWWVYNHSLNKYEDSGIEASLSFEVGTVTTGEAGTQASIENAGTQNDVVLNMTIPKGDKGTDGKVQQVNGKDPDSSGNLTLTASDVGAAPSIHAAQHATGGSDPITPESIGAAAASDLDTKVKISWYDGDLDTLYADGHYWLGGNVTNGPNGLGAYLQLIASRGTNTDTTSQIMIGHSGFLYARTYFANTWNSWKFMVTGALNNVSYTVNDGESIQTIINNLPKFGNGYQAEIIVKGTHAENLSIVGFSGYSDFRIRFDANGGAVLNGSITINSDCLIRIVQYGPITEAKYGTINAGNSDAIICERDSSAVLVGFNVISSSTHAINAQFNSQITMQYCTVKATGSNHYDGALYAHFGSTILVSGSTTISSDTPVGISAVYQSTVRFYGTNNAATKYVTYAGGKVESN